MSTSILSKRQKDELSLSSILKKHKSHLTHTCKSKWELNFMSLAQAQCEHSTLANKVWATHTHTRKQFVSNSHSLSQLSQALMKPRLPWKFQPLFAINWAFGMLVLHFILKVEILKLPKHFKLAFWLPKTYFLVWFIVSFWGKIKQPLRWSEHLFFLRQHKVKFGHKGHKIISISFDKEPSVMSNQVQTFSTDISFLFMDLKSPIANQKWRKMS